MERRLQTLPLLPSGPAWEGLTAVQPPEPDLPQGEYSDTESPADLPVLAPGKAAGPVELLAPAGGPEAAFAAFAYGADSIYLGLKKFSARAEAENFTLDEAAQITAYAHALQPRRRVFVTINTLIREDEIGELIDCLGALSDMEVDALIIQDLGVYRLVSRYFPELELHASTQLAVHNRAGAEALKRLGFKRVVLARELTFEEVHDITSAAGIETEVFIHGALCYSYSGLCLFSSQTLGRSGNRGKCAYSCRDDFAIEGAPETLRDGRPVKRSPARGFPFSMKDLALPDHLPALRSAGVSCFKIEGRKKSPLYVATTTDYYRRLLDGRLDAGQRPLVEADLQTVFSRPWTRLFVQSHRDKEVADRDTVGHRGTWIGTVAGVAQPHTERARLRFFSTRALELHDGLQVDLPVLGKPYGFAVDALWVLDGGRRERARPVVQAPAGAIVEVRLPPDHPHLPEGAPVYCSSSQDVKRRYRYSRPRSDELRPRRSLRIQVFLSERELAVDAVIEPRWPAEAPLPVHVSLSGPFDRARQAGVMEAAARAAFQKLGDSPFTLTGFTFENPGEHFVPVSRLNQVRRDLTAACEQALERARADRLTAVAASLALSPQPSHSTQAPLWSIKVDRIEYLRDFTADDWLDVDEAVVDITRDPSQRLVQELAALEGKLGRERIRLALPALTRKWEEPVLMAKVQKLLADGWRRWEAANLSAWTYLQPLGNLDNLATDWSVYVVNRQAARQVLELGATRFALSPEDGFENIKALLAEFRTAAVVIVYQDTPLFLAESCAYANLIGGCPGKANCKFESMDMVSRHGEKVTALDYHCRTIVLNQGPFCLAKRVPALVEAGAMRLRADFVYRPYQSMQVRDRWRAVRSGRNVPGGHAANFDRGLL